MNDIDPQDRLRSPKELAAAFSVSHKTIKRWRAQGFVMIHHRGTIRGLLSWLHRRDQEKGKVRRHVPA